MSTQELRAQQASSARTPTTSTSETSVVALLASVRRHVRLIAALAAAGLLIGVAVGMTRPHTYTTHVSFTADDEQSGLSGSIATQLGLGAILGATGGTSAQLYLDLLKSPVILGPVADSTYQFTDPDGKRERATLNQLYGGSARTPREAHANAVAKLMHEMHTEVRPSGAVAVDVKTTSRELSRDIAAQIFARLEQFTATRRVTRAADEREFEEGRVASAQGDLRAAEARLQGFLQQNRAYQNSPALTFEQERLQRDVEFRQAVYTAVAQAYEQARMAEARNTPTLSIVEPPALADRQDPRWGGAKAGLLGLVVGLALGLTFATLRDFFDRAVEANPDDAAELVRLR